jgi:hypothetical protein
MAVAVPVAATGSVPMAVGVSVATAVAVDVAIGVNGTVAVGVTVPVAVTGRVTVAVCAVVAVAVGVSVAVRVRVSVAVAVNVGVGSGVSTVRLQPRAIDPPVKIVSSTTKSCQVPFGSVPLKAERALPYGPDGAVAGKMSGSPGGTLSMFVGLNVPVTMSPASGRKLVAASSNVNVTLSAFPLEPVSDISTTVVPVGPTRRTSTSFGNWWEYCVIVTVTFVTAPDTPETLTSDGYGVADPKSGMTIGVVLANGPAMAARAAGTDSGRATTAAPTSHPTITARTVTIRPALFRLPEIT